MAQRRGLAGDGGAGDDLQGVAPAQREFLAGQRGQDWRNLLRLLLEIDLEFPMILSVT